MRRSDIEEPGTANNEPRQRRLAGGLTTPEERAGTDQIAVTAFDDALQLEQTVAPAGEPRVVVTNRASEALTVGVSRLDAAELALAGWPDIETGGALDELVLLEEGAYEFTGALASGKRLEPARLTVQPQEALPEEENDSAPSGTS